MPGFFVIWTTQICHFLESAPTQRGAHLSLSPTQVFRGVSIFHFSSTQVFQRVAHLSLFINPSFSEGCPSLTFHQPKFFRGVPISQFYELLLNSERWGPLWKTCVVQMAKKPWHTLPIIFSINLRGCPISLGQAVISKSQFDEPPTYTTEERSFMDGPLQKLFCPKHINGNTKRLR